MSRYLISLFFYKNLKIIKFYWKSLLSLIIISAVIIFLYLNRTYAVSTIPETTFYTKSTDMYKSYFTGEENDHILYFPSNNVYINEIMEKVREDLSIHPERLQSFDNKKEMYLTLNDKKFTRTFAISFDTNPNNIQNIGKLNYSISSTSSKLSTLKKYQNDEDIVGIKEHDDYTATGFWILQYCIDINFIKIVNNNNEDLNDLLIEISQFPHIDIKSVDSTRMLTFGILFAMLFFIILLNSYIIPLVEEYQTGITNLLKLTTPYYYYNYITFYILCLIIYFIFSIFCLAIGYLYEAVDNNCHMVITLLTLTILFINSSMLLGNLIALIFNDTFSAKIGGFLLLFVSILIYFIDSYKMSVWLLPGSSFLDGIKILQTYTNKHRKFTLGCLIENITENSFMLFTIFIILILQSLLYGIIYFIFAYKNESLQLFGKNKSTAVKPFNKNELQPAEYAINLKKVSKTYKHFQKSFLAVKDLSMDIEKNCINVLLGHNGAGKTTVINMIVGIINKDSGHILIDNEPQNKNNITKLGYCSQNNIFMQYMTCYEHIKFFAQLRGMTEEEADISSINLLEQLKLTEKKDVFGHLLSGGMKRRLCLGIAVAGNTKCIILDEPSSGLDPESRRDLWNILLDLRKNHSILLTTHHMEEAEILGDRILIISDGKLLCFGSTLELKKQYGTGYILKLLTNSNFNVDGVLSHIRESIPEAKIQAIVKPTFFIILPYSGRKQYSGILSQLENDKFKYGIEQLSITDTTLEEVFLNTEIKLCSVDEVDTIGETRITIPYKRYTQCEEEIQLNKNIKNNKSSHRLSLQVKAIFYKKCIYLKSHWIQILLMCAIPVLATGLTTILIKSSGMQYNGEKPLQLNLNHLNKNGIIYFKIHDFGIHNENHYSKLKSCLEIELPTKYHTKPIFLNSTNEGIEIDLLDIQKNNNTNALSYFYDNVLGAIEIKRNNEITMLFSTNILHSSVIMLNFLDNLLLNNFDCNGNDKRIETFNLPFNQDNEIIEINPFRLDFYTIVMPIGWFLYMMMFITLPYFEERSGFKNLQSISSITYWITYTFTDFILHFIVCCILYLVHIICFKTMNIYDLYEIHQIMVATLFYGLAYLPILYLLARIFRSMSSISSFLFFIFIISTILPIITSNGDESINYYSALISTMCIFPDFLFKHQLKLINENYFNRLRNKASTYISLNPHLIGQQYHDLKTYFIYIIFIWVAGEIFLIYLWDNVTRRNKFINLISKLNCMKIYRNRNAKLEEEINGILDEDVQQEEKRISIIENEKNEKDYTIILKDLQKSYEDANQVVKNVNLIVEKGQCFGLLGLNGAGKTTMFEMLTANQDITKGNILIYGQDINDSKGDNKTSFGYCPQQDALNNFMTSYEILKYMALLRGISSDHIDENINDLLTDFNMFNYKDQTIQGYSGGTKRKLNAAMAIIGNPQLILLDEPTTGVDPLSRRFIWKKIQNLQKEDKTIVLTSHSMDECENLCNRLAIMAKGKFKCIGYIPKLKSKYGNGFTINIRLKKLSHVNDVINCMKEELKQCFTDCTLREHHGEMLIYFVKTDTITICWSDVFKYVENIFQKYSENMLEDYSINEISLQDVFLKFDEKDV